MDIIPPRIAANIDWAGPCWLWTRATTKGYGVARVDRRLHYVHRLVWTLLVGPIPEGIELDHLCRNTVCCNPDHLDPVTHRVNSLRGYSPTAAQARKTHCKRGHEFTPENTVYYGTGRRCRTCVRVIAQERWADPEKRAAQQAATAAWRKHQTSNRS